MASAGDVRAGGAYVEISANDSSLMTSLSGLEGKIASFATGAIAQFAIVGTAITATFGSAFKFLDEAGKIKSISERVGVSTEDISKLGYAGEVAGVGIEKMLMPLRRSAMFLTQASLGSKEATDTLQMLGISMEDIQGKSPVERFMLLGQALERINDPTIKAAMYMKLFGRSGSDMIEFFNKGAGQLNGWMNEAGNVGRVVTSQQGEMAEAFEIAYNRMNGSAQGFIMQLGATLLPIMSSAIERIQSVITSVIAWNQQNDNIIGKLPQLITGIAGVGSALVVLVTAINVAVGAGGLLAKLFLGGLQSTAIFVLIGALGIVAEQVTGIDLGISSSMEAMGGWADKIKDYIVGVFWQIEKSITRVLEIIFKANSTIQTVMGNALLSAGLITEEQLAAREKQAESYVNHFKNLQAEFEQSSMQAFEIQRKQTESGSMDFFKMLNTPTPDMNMGMNNATNAMLSGTIGMFGGRGLTEQMGALSTKSEYENKSIELLSSVDMKLGIIAENSMEGGLA